MRTRRAPSRSRRLGVAASAAIAVVALSSCTFHPGQAALVNGQRISQDRVTDLVEAGCNYFEVTRKSAGGAAPSTSMAYMRNLFTGSLISFRITDLAARQMGITVSPAVIAKTRAQQAPSLPHAMDPQDREWLSEYFDASAKASLQEATIGAHLKDPSVTTADTVTSSTLPAGQKYLQRFTLDQHVVVNPAFGSWIDGDVVDTDGSLSAAASGDAKEWLSLRAENSQSVTGLPPSQVCG